MNCEEVDGEIVIYGDNIIQMDDEELVLKSRPEFALFPDIEITELMEEIESCLAKIRWQRDQEDRAKEAQRVAEETGRDQEEEVERRHPHNPLDNTFDMSSTRPTDMKANKKIIMPNPRSDQEEMLLATRRNLWLRISEDYIK